MDIAIFSNSSNGEFNKPYVFDNLENIFLSLGISKKNIGIDFAVNSIFKKNKIIFFRVKEEDVSTEDYFFGFDYLKNEILSLDAIFIPNVGSSHIIEASLKICNIFKSILIINQNDFYD